MPPIGTKRWWIGVCTTHSYDKEFPKQIQAYEYPEETFAGPVYDDIAIVEAATDREADVKTRLGETLREPDWVQHAREQEGLLVFSTRQVKFTR